MTYKLDLKDKQILYELDKNARLSYSALAKKVLLKQNSVMYRIEQLKERGIIKGFRTIIDVGKLGYITSNLFFDLQNITPEKENQIIEFLKSNNNVNWVASVEGDYNIGVSIITKNVGEIKLIWEDLMRRYMNYIAKRRFTILFNMSYFSRAYLIDAKINHHEIEIVTEPKLEAVDLIDMKIIAILNNDCRTKIVDISRKIEITPKTVISRIKNLEEKKIIRGYKVSIDIEQLGYETYKICFMLNNLTRDKIVSFLRYAKDHPNITFYIRDIGGEDFEIQVEVKNSSELRVILDDIESKYSDIIRDYKTMLFFKGNKHIYFPEKI
jgi:DNA-binding Lrp family transcriptional regulator